MLKFAPSCKECYCLNFLLATRFSASFVHAAFDCTTSFAERVAEHQNVFSTFSFRIHVLPLHSNLNRNWQKKHLHFGNSSANIVLHSKAAKTPSCWKCCCQQQTGTKKLLTEGAKIQQHGVDFALAILNILPKDFYCLNCLLVKLFAANFVHADL